MSNKPLHHRGRLPAHLQPQQSDAFAIASRVCHDRLQYAASALDIAAQELQRAVPKSARSTPRQTQASRASKPPGLKEIAAHLGLSPASVSMVLNDVPLARAMTPATRKRILEAARDFNYRPNLLARSLSKRETRTIGVIVPEATDGYYTRVMRGIEEALLDAGYLYLTVSHLSREDLLREYPLLLRQRAVDGMLFLNTRIAEPTGMPMATISYNSDEPNTTSVTVDQRVGTRMQIEHLATLGHRRILMMRGQSTCLESGERWRLLLKAAKSSGIEVRPELSLEMDHHQLTPELAYDRVRAVLRAGHRFTAVCAFNDTSAIGAMRALADAGIACPHDVSIIGFDDISLAGFITPRLTTIRQPLEAMGRRAAEALIARIREPEATHATKITLPPELVVRESTAPAPRAVRRSGATTSVGRARRSEG